MGLALLCQSLAWLVEAETLGWRAQPANLPAPRAASAHTTACSPPTSPSPLHPQAIDLIDEAGSRVRLRHAQLPEEARELDKELRALLKEKDAAVRGQDFEKAGSLRDREMELKSQISAITSSAKDSQVGAGLGDGGSLRGCPVMSGAHAVPE